MENKFRFYNTLTREIETVIPNEDGKISMYTCGPTVYHYAHIGNIRTYIMQDALVKSLDEYKNMSSEELRNDRYNKFRAMGEYLQ